MKNVKVFFVSRIYGKISFVITSKQFDNFSFVHFFKDYLITGTISFERTNEPITTALFLAINLIENEFPNNYINQNKNNETQSN